MTALEAKPVPLETRVDEFDALDPLYYPTSLLRDELKDLLGANIKHEGQRHLRQLENKRRIVQVRRALAILEKNH